MARKSIKNHHILPPSQSRIIYKIYLILPYLLGTSFLDGPFTLVITTDNEALNQTISFEFIFQLITFLFNNSLIFKQFAVATILIALCKKSNKNQTLEVLCGPKMVHYSSAVPCLNYILSNNVHLIVILVWIFFSFSRS